MSEQVINVNFAQGMDTKPDPWQLPVGKFQSLKNSVFTKTGLLAKRPGYQALTALPATSTYLTTLNKNLIAVNSTISAYDAPNLQWISKGQLQPCSLTVLPLIRNNLNQTQADTVIAPNGLACTVYSELNNSTTVYKYAVADSVTGQNIIAPTLLVGTSGTVVGSPRVFQLGVYFILVYTVAISGSYYLQYIAVSVNNPVVVTGPVDLVGTYTPNAAADWDGVVTNNNLYIVFNTLAGGQAIKAVYISNLLSLSATHTLSAGIATIMSVTVDETNHPNPLIYANYYDSVSSTGYSVAVDTNLNVVMSATEIISSGTVANITAVAQGGVCSVFFEVAAAAAYTGGLLNNYVESLTVTPSMTPNTPGTVGTPFTSIRSVGLASKAAIYQGVVYYLAIQSSTFQPTYFLINGSLSTSLNPIIVAKLAYQNGGSLYLNGLPYLGIYNTTLYCAYFFKDDVQALSVLSTPQMGSAGGIYSQTGINLASFDVNTQDIDTVNIASNLFITGGYLSQFDGYVPVESSFFLFPENVTAVASATSGSMAAAEYWYSVTYEWTDNQGYAYRSQPSIPTTVTLTSDTSVTVNIPMLRLTSKTTNVVKIVIYRYSLLSGAYNQVTSITAPILNDTTVDSYAYTDTLADSSVIGNNILYTTGGVVPDTNGPACNGIMTLFDTRLWLVDAEDPNLLWVSKQVIEGTTVEMSSYFTIYCAPNQGTVASTGPITALAPMDDKLIIFKENAIYYINGTGPDNLGTTQVGCPLGQYSQPTFCTSVVGCTNQQSIVMTSMGLMFQSDKGIWLLSRDLQTSYIGSPVEAFNGATVNSANAIPGTNYVVFTLSTGQSLMYDYYVQQWGTFEGAPAVSSTLYQDLHTIVDQYGNISQATPGVYADIDNPVLMSFVTSWLNLAGLQGYERFYEFYMLANFLSPHSLLCQVAYDYNPSVSNSQLITPTPQRYSSPVPSPFGVPTPFGAPTSKEQYRVHAKKQLCESFQLAITEVAVQGQPIGAGFTMSGIDLVVDIKKGYRPTKAASAVGMQ
jgi:hypothetical protein